MVCVVLCLLGWEGGIESGEWSAERVRGRRGETREVIRRSTYRMLQTMEAEGLHEGRSERSIGKGLAHAGYRTCTRRAHADLLGEVPVKPFPRG